LLAHLIELQEPNAAHTLKNLVYGNLSNLGCMEFRFLAIPYIDETIPSVDAAILERMGLKFL